MLLELVERCDPDFELLSFTEEVASPMYRKLPTSLNENGWLYVQIRCIWIGVHVRYGSDALAAMVTMRSALNGKCGRSPKSRRLSYPSRIRAPIRACSLLPHRTRLLLCCYALFAHGLCDRHPLEIMLGYFPHTRCLMTTTT